MNVGSLFSGIGGIEIGFEKQGFKTIWFIEKEPYAQTILRKRFPTATIYEDITTTDFSTVQKIDILTGGFPCQDISNAGKRIGITGSRSSLWKYYLEAIRVLRPKYALIENVSALTIRGLNVVLSDLAQIGYDAEWYNLSASAVGAPHRRERIFIIAYPNSNGQCSQGHEQTSEQDNLSEERKAEIGSERAEWKHEVSELSSDVSNTNISRLERQHKSKHPSWKSKETFRCGSDDKNVENTNSNGDGERAWEDDLRGSKIEESSSDIIKRSSRYRGQWAVEPNVGRVAHGVSNRIHRIRCLGNAVVPQCAEVFCTAIKKYEEVKE